MYSTQHAVMTGPPQGRSVAPETFLLDQDAQQSLPADSIVALQQVDNLKYFLISAPVDWSPDQYIRRFLLPTGEYVSCVLWSNLFHISGTDIVRCLSFRFQAFGRPVKNSKKFEEGIFSDLRNLKSGTDASLEEPKSPFLDFLYKNNCIRTQKKQKVFYWYSVPHDRLFLDALERDLKREKMGQEATTVAVSEPALSFEFDSSQSLFEQLTKAQQTSSSTFASAPPPASGPMAANTMAAAAGTPQPMGPPPSTSESMGPPVGAMMQATSMPLAMPPEEMLTQMPTYQQMAMQAPLPVQVTKTREQSCGPIMHYERAMNAAARHSSMPAYMEYSPAPSFVSSHFEDYSQRGMSYEPITPPQHQMHQQQHHSHHEPAYIANEETGLYAVMPDPGMSQYYNPLMPVAQPMAAPQYPSMMRPLHHYPSALEGSPTYKQRRRRSSLTQQPPSSTPQSVTSHAVHRPSDLRHASVPVHDVDPVYHDSPRGATPVRQQKDYSRHATPVDDVPPAAMPLGQDEYAQAYPGDQYRPVNYAQAAVMRTPNGVFRRARSATVQDMNNPYPSKSHSCPIPMCGRVFKRLEHLKRHVRTHTSERPYVCPLCNKAFSRSDNLAQHRRTHDANPDGTVFPEEDLEEPEEGLDLSEGDVNDSYISMPGMHSDMGPPPSHMHMSQISRDHMDPHHMDHHHMEPHHMQHSMPQGIVSTGAEYQ
ncbi:hypothetical protein AUEXF2481DRAFT_71004 [Aureobasidium subglaciale EXF-2481]|uniref:C2H2-type domain-containing protein n=1 Tax=Aureobasidium subglaciale (strain EXF-2481) TaxID=1043005 RepID=A0A074YV21_AURSE|nr:uncharacterized protein AUEXF2481DRAFT_71004 [Aureobasidium subglaciale EXF-2481]KAI5201477.1 STE-domain-containing protein [Aureobasidium subglaciale]KAI5220097.1 STE-domain-containing protein [Aureobasidium subglaciale]KAI5223995.1 STE-domain-containing protein [Aureobasidium subglaciale]KAI5260682.1 STE-domain-containing protein [Aureobasidium subglaciale]KEQ90691.1 hypothetical protein AUEXF2481DRAFT_71004 [Aureobasidium subglaciale EXF-2481]